MDAGLINEIARVESGHWWFQSRKVIATDYIARRILPGRAAPDEPFDILDVGAGTGLMAEAMGKLGRVRALEAAPAALKALRKRSGIEIIESLLPDPGLATGSFGLITSFDVIEHVDDDSAILGEMARLARPGGHVLLTVPGHPFLWTSHDEANDHHRRYRASELKEKIRNAGLEIEFFSSHLSLLFPAFLAQRFFMRAKAPENPADVVSPPGKLVNAILFRLYSFERHWLSRGIAVPVGSSFLVHARKPRG